MIASRHGVGVSRQRRRRRPPARPAACARRDRRARSVTVRRSELAGQVAAGDRDQLAPVGGPQRRTRVGAGERRARAGGAGSGTRGVGADRGVQPPRHAGEVGRSDAAPPGVGMRDAGGRPSAADAPSSGSSRARTLGVGGRARRAARRPRRRGEPRQRLAARRPGRRCGRARRRRSAASSSTGAFARDVPPATAARAAAVRRRARRRRTTGGPAAARCGARRSSSGHRRAGAGPASAAARARRSPRPRARRGSRPGRSAVPAVDVAHVARRRRPTPDRGRCRRTRPRTAARPRRGRRAIGDRALDDRVEVVVGELAGVLGAPTPARCSGVGLDVELDAPREPAEPERLLLARRRAGQLHRARRQRVHRVEVPLEHVRRDRQGREQRVGRPRPCAWRRAARRSPGRPGCARTWPPFATASNWCPRQTPSVGTSSATRVAQQRAHRGQVRRDGVVERAHRRRRARQRRRGRPDRRAAGRRRRERARRARGRPRAASRRAGRAGRRRRAGRTRTATSRA